MTPTAISAPQDGQSEGGGAAPREGPAVPVRNAGETIDIAASRALLRTAINSGSEVVTPTLGQTVYIHAEWSISGNPNAVTVAQRAVIDTTTFCSFTLSATAGGWISWCNASWTATAGTHTLRWDFDYTGTVAETNENNNSASKTFTPTGTDIAATRAYLRTASSGGGSEVVTPALGQAVYFHADWSIGGNANAVTVSQRAVMDGNTFCSFSLSATAGNWTSWCLDPWTTTAGTHTLQWDFDYTSAVGETNESNNSTSKLFTPSGTDIAATRASMRTASGNGGTEVPTPTPGQAVYFHGEWTIGGNANAVSVSQRAVIDGSTFCSFSFSATAGGWISWCGGAWTATSGTHTLQWDFDYTGTVAETLEGNNSTLKSFTVSGPPTAFNKISPANNATGQPSGVTLSWGASGGLETATSADDRSPKVVGPAIRIEPLDLMITQKATTPIYVEIDWMETAGHSHKPSQTVIDAIVQTFAREGYTIVIDVSNALTEQSVLAVTGSPSGSAAVQAIRNSNFNHANDSRYFYSIWGHNYSLNGSFTTSSGIADLPGSTHLVTLGSFANSVGTQSNQIGTFIHEFGHNIGQLHGGVDSGNYKPNYLSVMNYHYQLNGVGPSVVALNFANTSSGFNAFGYSHGISPSLNEANLNENLGIGLGRAVDWNCNGILSTGVAKDIQDSNYCGAAGGQSVLTDYDNWSAIEAFVRTGALAPQGIGGSSQECANPADDRQVRTAIEALRAQGVLPDEQSLLASVANPSSALGDAADIFTVFNDGSTALNVTGIALDTPAAWVTWEPQTFSVAPGGSQIVHVYVNFATMPGGSSSRRLLITSNDPANSPYPNGVNLNMGHEADPLAITYEYCVDTINNNACDSSWVPTGSNTSANLAGLAPGRQFFWQVRASNTLGTTYANGGATASWKFTTSSLMDLNGDNRGDVLTYSPASGAWARQTSQAAGGFTSNSGSWAVGWTVTPAEFNGDGLMDVFLVNTTTGDWSKMLNDGTGYTTQSSGGWWPGWQRFVLDLNGDGVSDLFLYDPATGTWFKCVATPAGFNYTQGGWNPGWEITPIRLNSDALGDLFLIDRITGRWFWVLGQAGPGFTYPVTDVWFPSWNIHPGDFNGDGLGDMLLHHPVTGTYFVATNTGAGFTYSQGGWSLGWTPYVADLNGDGAQDLFLHDPATGVWFEMISNGTGNFSNAGGQIWSLGWNIFVTDFNGDGRADLLLYHPTSGVWYQARNLVLGTFTFSSGTWAPDLAIVVRSPFM